MRFYSSRLGFQLCYCRSVEYRQKILEIRSDFLRGKITYEQAKAKVLPFLEEMNIKGAKIAKKFGKKYKKLTFGYVFR